ncbi:MAG: helix-turn-helix domain containing protein [Azospirillaceae bacterium]|nr:helix-turn-helix domain containing protein [Azospirillaceae bacterium]
MKADAAHPGPRLTLRQEQRDLTRRRITRAARACFYEGGVEGTSMEQVAAAAGVSRATLYLHFVNKDALLLALLSSNLRGVRELYRGLPARLDKAAAAKWLTDYVQVLRGHRDAMRLFHIGLASSGEARELVDDHREAVIDILAESFSALARTGENARHRHARAILALARVDHVASALAEDEPRIDADASLDLVAEELVSVLTG